MSAFLLCLSFLLSCVGIARMIAAGRQLQRAGHQNNYDFFTWNYARAMFDDTVLPVALRPHFRQLRYIAFTLLLPAVGLMFIAFWMEGFYLGKR